MSDNIVNLNEVVNTEDLSTTIKDTESMAPLISMFEAIMSIDDASLTGVASQIYAGILKSILTPELRAQLIDEIVITLKREGISSATIEAKRKEIIDSLLSLIDELKPSKPKRDLLSTYVNEINSIYSEAIEKFNGVAIVLPIKLSEGGQIPTYAHDSDAAADIYSAKDMILAPHSLSNFIPTGVSIELPENWVAIIVPRSSIGMKSGLRLSNSQGVIDPHYRGEIGVIYDNHSDSEYIIHKGDRIAQMYVMPVYRFKAIEVDTLNESDRGEGAYGSTGK